MRKPSLSPADVTALCDAAAKAWDKLTGRKSVARFEWRGVKYRATRSIFRLQVQSADNRRCIAERWD